MILVLKPGSTEEQRRELIREIENLGLKVHVSVGVETTIIGLIGDVSRINTYALSSHEIVANTMRSANPSKANRMFKPVDTVMSRGRKIGAGHFVLISGRAQWKARADRKHRP